MPHGSKAAELTSDVLKRTTTTDHPSTSNIHIKSGFSSTDIHVSGHFFVFSLVYGNKKIFIHTTNSNAGMFESLSSVTKIEDPPHSCCCAASQFVYPTDDSVLLDLP